MKDEDESRAAYYKVVRRIYTKFAHKNFVVFCSVSVPEECRHSLRYAIGKKTTPLFGGILAFMDKREAEEFIGRFRFRSELHLLEVEGEEMPLPSCRAGDTGCEGFCRCMWGQNDKARSVVRYDDLVEDWPEGTVALRWCRPIRVVE